MNPTNIMQSHSSLIYKVSKNGKIIDNVRTDTNFDGNNLLITTRDGDSIDYHHMTKQDILKLFNTLSTNLKIKYGQTCTVFSH